MIDSMTIMPLWRFLGQSMTRIGRQNLKELKGKEW